MNLFIADGWLRTDAEFRRTPGGRDVVCLEVMVRDPDSVDDHLLRLRLTDPAIIARCGEHLTRGRTVFVHASYRTEPVTKAGGIVGDRAVWIVRELKVPNRSKERETAEERDNARPAAAEVPAP